MNSETTGTFVRRSLGAFAAFALMAHAGASISITPVALTGTDGPLGPGMGAGVTFSAIGGQQVGINGAGQLAFRANPSSAGTPQGVWVHGGLSNMNVALAGGARPGGGTYTAGTDGIFNTTQINASGDWALRLGASTGLFASTGGTPARAMLTGDAAPGGGGALYSSSASGMPLFNNAGQIGYIANLAVNATSTPPVTIGGATGNSSGIWTGLPSSPNLVLRQNDAVLSLDAGGNVRVGTLQNLSLSMNGSGRYAAISALQGTVTTGNGAGSNAGMIATDRSGTLEVVARVGNAAPDATGAPSATDLYRNLGTSAVGFNNAGRVAFVSSLRNAAGTQTFTSALFTDTGSGVLRMVGRSTDALPVINGARGAEFQGVTWGSFGTPILTSSGNMAFTASLANTGSASNTNVIMTMNAGGTFNRTVRSGDIAIVDGAPLGGNAFFTSFSNVVVNDSLQMGFSAILNGAGIFGGPGGNNNGLFAFDPVGGLVLLARTSDLFEAAPGSFRTIAAIGGFVSSGGEDGRVQTLTSDGRLAFELEFTDGSSGIYVATIPSPAALPLLGLAGLVISRRRR